MYPLFKLVANNSHTVHFPERLWRRFTPLEIRDKPLGARL
jgi:hypothetical protein